MELTDELKAQIDAMSYRELLSRWRFTPIGDPLFEGPSEEYWGNRMLELRHKPGGEAVHIEASKAVGWGTF